jgi:hypothetical protein
LKTDPFEISGLTLLEKALEFGSMKNVEADWILNNQNYSTSRFVRLQQINILLSVFTPETFDPTNITSGYDSLLNGDFILKRDIKVYKNLIKSMDNVITTSNYYPNKMQEWSLFDLQSNYCHVVMFKNSLNNVLDHNSGMMEIGYQYFFPVIITKNIIEQIDTKEIDNFLSLVIDPKGKTISKNKIIASHNYPKEDVYDIDLDNW